jgi:GT2 family glycosyltransferase
VFVSLVIVNKDDRGVAHTLLALDGIEPDQQTEIVLVDASEGRLDDVRDAFPQVRWIEFRPRSDKPTIAEQRNVGVASSRGEIVVFIDASCVPDPGWLSTLIRPLVEEGELIVAGSHRSAGKRSIRDEDAHFVGNGRYIPEAPTLNLAVHRSVFERIGGFDEAFRYGSDLDFTWRAVDHGYRIRYVPEARVTHDWGTSWRDLRRTFVYGQARYHLYAKHLCRRRRAWREDWVSLAYPLFLIASPVCVVAPRILMLLAIPLVKNIRHRPVLTVVHHFVYAAGILSAAFADLTGGGRYGRA